MNNLLPNACQSGPDLSPSQMDAALHTCARFSGQVAGYSSKQKFQSIVRFLSSRCKKSCNVQIRQLVMLTYLVDALMNVYSSLCPGSTKRSHRAWRRLRSQQAGSCVSGPPTLMRQRRAFGGTGASFVGLFVVLVCSVHVSKGLIRNSVSTLLLSGQVLWQGN